MRRVALFSFVAVVAVVAVGAVGAACAPTRPMTRTVDRAGDALSNSIGGLKDCYVGRLTGETPLEGSVMLNLTIADDGSAVKARPSVNPECP